MRTKPLTYVDAVVLLGGQSRVVAGLANLAGAGLAVASAGHSVALSLFGLKDEVESLGQKAVVTLRNRIKKLNRFKRSEMLEAAHAVLVVTAFFAALDDLSTDVSAALNSASLEMTAAEQAALAGGSGSVSGLAGLADFARELIAPGAVPGLDAGWSDHGSDLRAYYEVLAGRIRDFATGTAVWDKRDETTRTRWMSALTDELPRQALARYEERLSQLAGEFPEFAFWAHRVGVQSVLERLSASRQETAELGRMVQTLAGLMQSVDRDSEASKARSDLVKSYRRQLDKPIAGALASAIPAEVTLPHLRQVYVNPSYRTLARARFLGAEGVSEPSWQSVPRRDNLWAFVLEHLITTDSAHVPLMLLGQPGAGKSVFTQMLAAELDSRDYLVVRVELRAVPFDAGIQIQIERALADLTGRTVSWPKFAEDAGDAQLVILLDGFDELLQASGVSHFDFLERVQAFQEHETDLGRAVAVLVTSRSAVANQVRYPDGTVVVRLEEFDDLQVDLWLGAWNQANSARPLPLETAVAQGELARQPLLLFLLALFHSGGGDLTPDIGRAQLYHRLFTDFTDRDVTKTSAELSDQKRRQEVRRELDLLSIVAFAMFNRGHQTVSEAELVADLTALRAAGSILSEQAGPSAALTIAERMAGRFFFRLIMQRDQTIRGQQTSLSTYEFLHASFGEFLVARWVVDELRRLAELARRAADDIYRAPVDDGLLRTLLSVAVLSNQQQRVLDFIAELLNSSPADEIRDLRTLMTTLFRCSLQAELHDRYPEYRPIPQTLPAAYAVYSANMLLVLLLVAHADKSNGQPEYDGIALAELFEGTPESNGPEEQLRRFYVFSRLWHAQLPASEWDGLLDVIRVDVMAPLESATGRAVSAGFRIVRWTRGDHQHALSARRLLPRSGPHSAAVLDGMIWLDDPAGRALREAALLGSTGYRDACTALLPYLGVLGTSRAAVRFQIGDRAADMLALLMLTSSDMPIDQRTELYRRVARSELGLTQARILLSRLRDDCRDFAPSHELAPIVDAVRSIAWTNIVAYLDIVSSHFESLKTVQLDNKPKFDSAYVRHAMNMIDITDMSLVAGSSTLGFSRSARASRKFNDLRDMSDLFALFSDADTFDPRASRLFVRLTIFDNFSIWPEIVILRDLLGLTAIADLAKLTERQMAFILPAVSPIVAIALWDAMAQRGLPVAEPKRLGDSEAVKSLRAMVPEFVPRVRLLAAEHGYRDPFPYDADLDGPAPADV
jgi:hypothetical protein